MKSLLAAMNAEKLAWIAREPRSKFIYRPGRIVMILIMSDLCRLYPRIGRRSRLRQTTDIPLQML